MNGDASGLEFRGMAKLLVAEPAVGIGQAIEGSLVQLRHLHAPVCIQALQPMNSPNFGTRVDVEKRKNVLRISPRDDNHSCPGVAYDFLQQERNSGIRVRLVAADVERRQRSVVIEQEYGVGCLGYSLQKRRELGLHFRPQTRCSFLRTGFDLRRSAPKGAFDSEGLAVSLKRYPDTKPEIP